jgi:hypothetical protein
MELFCKWLIISQKAAERVSPLHQTVTFTGAVSGAAASGQCATATFSTQKSITPISILQETSANYRSISTVTARGVANFHNICPWLLSFCLSVGQLYIKIERKADHSIRVD